MLSIIIVLLLSRKQNQYILDYNPINIIINYEKNQILDKIYIYIYIKIIKNCNLLIVFLYIFSNWLIVIPCFINKKFSFLASILLIGW